MKRTRLNLLGRKRAGSAPFYEKKAGLTPRRVAGILWLVTVGILVILFTFFRDVDLITFARGNVLFSAMFAVFMAIFVAERFMYLWRSDSWDDFRMGPVFKVLGIMLIIFFLVVAFLGVYIG